MMELKLGKFEEYKAQQEKQMHASARLQDEKNAALAVYKEVKTEYEIAAVRSLDDESITDKELSKLYDKVSAAKKAADIAASKHNAFIARQSIGGITRQDIIDAWNTELLPRYEAEVLAGVKERLRKARAEMFEATAEYFAAVSRFERYRDEVSGTLHYDFPFHFHGVGIETRSEANEHFYYSEDNDKAKFEGSKR